MRYEKLPKKSDRIKSTYTKQHNSSIADEIARSKWEKGLNGSERERETGKKVEWYSYFSRQNLWQKYWNEDNNGRHVANVPAVAMSDNVNTR